MDKQGAGCVGAEGDSMQELALKVLESLDMNPQEYEAYEAYMAPEATAETIRHFFEMLEKKVKEKRDKSSDVPAPKAANGSSTSSTSGKGRERMEKNNAAKGEAAAIGQPQPTPPQSQVKRMCRHMYKSGKIRAKLLFVDEGEECERGLPITKVYVRYFKDQGSQTDFVNVDDGEEFTDCYSDEEFAVSDDSEEDLAVFERATERFVDRVKDVVKLPVQEKPDKGEKDKSGDKSDKNKSDKKTDQKDSTN